MTNGSMTLVYGSFEPLLFALVMAASIAAFLWRWNRGQMFHAVGMVLAYLFLLTLHRSHAASISMAMAIAVLIVDLIVMPIVFRGGNRRKQ